MKQSGLPGMPRRLSAYRQLKKTLKDPELRQKYKDNRKTDWQNPEYRRKQYESRGAFCVQLVSPEGAVHTVRSLKEHAKEHNLSRSALSNVITGRAKRHKGWTLYSANKEAD